MPFGTKKKIEKTKTEKTEKTEKEEKEKNNKIKPQLNPYCSKCPHRPPQSLTPEDPRRYQKEKSYKKLCKLK